MLSAHDEGGFFGRARDLVAIGERLAVEGALVTIVGPPGVGKTRLAVEVLKRLGPIDHVPCDLSEVRTAGAMLERLAELFRIGSGTASLVERVGDALAEHAELLIVLDNAEQLIETAAPVLRALRQAAPRVRWLVTSREPLALLGEWRHEVEPLRTGAGDADAEATAMLADRVTRARGAAPPEVERAILARIGVKLDGLPLALELAASRIATLGASAVEERLEQQLDVLTHGPRDLDPRQRTLRRAIAWSWELLAPSEQRVLAQLSVFRGGFDLAAAEVVADASGALDAVQALRQKSLLFAHTGESGDVRFGLYLSIREFAAGELTDADAVAAHQRHAAHYARVVRRAAPGALVAERDNVFAAIERCTAIASPATIPLAAQLLLGGELLIDRSPLEPYLDRLEAFLSTTAAAEVLAPELRCRLQVTAGRCMRRLGRLRDAKRFLSDALALARAIGRPVDSLARIHAELGMVAFFESRIDDALAQWRTSMAMSRELGDDIKVGLDQTRCGMILREAGRMFESREILTDALATHRRSGADDGVVITLAELAMIHLELGEIEECERLLAEAAHHPGHRSLLSDAAVLARMAFVRFERGDHAGGTPLAQRALVLLTKIGYRRVEAGLVAFIAIADLHAGAAPAELRPQFEWAYRHLEVDRRATHIFGAWLGHVAWREGDAARARRLFDALPALEDGDPLMIASAILRIPLDVAEPNRRAAAEELATAALATTQRSARASSFDVRLAYRAIVDEHPIVPLTSEQPVLAIRPDGTEFTVAGAPHSLARYRTLRRLLLALADARFGAPGAPLDWEQLLAAGWPGERVHAEAARNRVKVAIATLRSMGLREAILHDGTGYLLDPQLEVRIVTA